MDAISLAFHAYLCGLLFGVTMYMLVIGFTYNGKISLFQSMFAMIMIVAHFWLFLRFLKHAL